MLRWRGRKRIFIKKTVRGIILVKGRNDTYNPPTGQSSRWKHWMTEQDPKVCSACEVMKSVIAGFGTKDGINGADWWLKHNGKLPDYYISKEDLYEIGYKWGKPPRKYAPGLMVYGGTYENKDGHLPSAPGREWYEADINYYEGQRNNHRIVWSNDGLIFVTCDHYHTFYEIT